jgi:hypothetical protein
MMTKKQMEELADMISTKIILELFGDESTRKRTMEQFHKDNEQEIPIGSIFPDLTTEELLIGELARLQTILMIYEGQDTHDGYVKAAKVLKKLRLIQKKLGDQ